MMSAGTFQIIAQRMRIVSTIMDLIPVHALLATAWVEKSVKVCSPGHALGIN